MALPKIDTSRIGPGHLSLQQTEQSDQLAIKLAEYERKIQELDDVIAAAELEIHRLDVYVDELESSITYHIARPVRLLKLLQHSFRNRGLRATLRRIFSRQARRRRIDWRLLAGIDATNYRNWINCYDRFEKEDCHWVLNDIDSWAERPLVSLVLTAPQGMIDEVQECLTRVRQQVYPDIEVLLVLPSLYAAAAQTWLQQVRELATRVKIVPCDEGISDAEMHRLAFQRIRGELTLHPRSTDHLSPSAVYLALRAYKRAPESSFIFSDEDQLNEENARVRPFFKPQRLGELALALDVAGSSILFVAEKVRAVGGPTASARSAWRWDLALRLMERFGPTSGLHVPFITSHRRYKWTEVTDLMASGQMVVAAYLQRTGIDADVRIAPNRQHLIVKYPRPNPLPLVTAIVATRDRVDLLRACLAGLLQLTNYPSLEVIVIDNDSEEPATKRYLDSLISDPRLKIIPCPGPFNFADLHNAVVPEASGEILALINNDVEVIGPDWLNEMVAQAARPSVGAVGAKLLYPFEKIQHAGVVMGLSGGADHIFRGLSAWNPGPHHLLNVAQNVAAVTGACMVLRRSVYLEVGGMDPQFAVNFNDVDLCLKIREHGYEVIWTPEAELIHRESISRGRASTEQTVREMREVALLKSRWSKWIEHDPYYNPNLSLDGPLRSPAFPPRVRLPWAVNGAAGPSRAPHP